MPRLALLALLALGDREGMCDRTWIHAFTDGRDVSPHAAVADLGLLDDDDMPLPLPRQLDPTLQRTSRLASLDPDDGIEL